MAWLQLTLQTKQTTADQLSEYLSEIGAVSVTFQDAEDQPILEPRPGETPLWKNITLTALFEQGSNPLQIQNTLTSTFDDAQIAELKFETLEDQDWERAWLDHFQPMQFGQRLWICPSTQAPPDPEAVNILLDPGLAFGTGTHPTTALCLEWLDEHAQTGQSIIDYGCGSGILAIAALKLGCEHALAIDNDPQALTATKDNAERNHIDLSQLEILLTPPHTGLTRKDEMRGKNLRGGGVYTQVHEQDEQVFNKADHFSRKPSPDLLVANILANPLIQLAPTLVSFLKPDTKIALSGILTKQAQEVQSTYEALGVKFKPLKNKEEWVLLHGSLV